jgi:hypothetical protein
MFWKRKKTVSTPSFSPGDVAGFWEWFRFNELAIVELNRKAKEKGGFDQAVCDAIGSAVHLFRQGLTFEAGFTAEGKFELIISADGIFAEFPSVLNLISGAYKSNLCVFTAFRPRLKNLSVNIHGLSLSDDNTFFAIRDSIHDTGRCDIAVMFDWNDVESDKARQAAYIRLDTTVGEYDVETLIAQIDCLDLKDCDNVPKRPFSELPDCLDQFAGTLRKN